MTELLTAAQMRAIEQAAIASGEVTGLELMERAGRGVVEAILEWRPELATAPHRAVVLCGPGNNGGDGFVVARLLKQRGWEVEVFLYGDEAKLPPDAAENARRWREMGEVGKAPPDPYEICSGPARTLLIDALFGTGLTRPIGTGLADFIDSINGQRIGPRPLIVSIDIPTGVCADSGRILGAAFDADLTVTFHAEKQGHRLSPGVEVSGSLAVKQIGLDHRGSDSAEFTQLLDNLTAPFVTKAFHRHDARRHKYDHGHALVLSGGVGRGGAARLAARGALRIGAGLVTLGVPSAALPENAARLDAIMLATIDDTDALASEMSARKVTAICIGPGFGTGARLRRFIEAAAQTNDHRDRNNVGVVFDADALTEYQDDPSALFEVLHPNCILTPHAGEFRRLFPYIHQRMSQDTGTGPAFSKIDATQEAAERAGCVVLFKGADTVIAQPLGVVRRGPRSLPATRSARRAVHSAHYDRAAPWLATAGSGDVLAGFITGLMARGLDPFAAAQAAAWLHVECARRFGPGLIAEDLPEQLPTVFRELGL